ncbi:hypothetical protein BDZ97DRAFT_1807603 [Flammula alnicola]|nr:hypothetical protein BDZ97DRAFT_1807603 [Flammula alnicola]
MSRSVVNRRRKPLHPNPGEERLAPPTASGLLRSTDIYSNPSPTSFCAPLAF